MNLLGRSLGGDVLYVKGIECSPLLSGFGIILSDGRAGFLMSTSAIANPMVSFGFDPSKPVLIMQYPLLFGREVFSLL